MAAPNTPTGFYAQTGNGQDYVSWDLTPTATSYKVQRSTDGIAYSLIASPVTPYYLDITVVLGTLYYYKVAATNIDGDSAYTDPQSVVPVPNGEMCLGQIREAAKQRADRQNSDFVTLPEWNSYINQSLYELYDLLVTAYGEEYFSATPVSFTTDGSSQSYPLPNGTNFSAAPSFYKMMGVDLAVSSANNAYVTVKKFNFLERNRYLYPNSASSIYGVFNMRYRIVGNNINFIPTPSANQVVRLWYVPRMTMLLQDTDITNEGISGWIEYVITDAAIKALQKEESDVSILAAQKVALTQRIISSAPNRDEGQPDTITDTAGSTGPWGTGTGGWGGMGPSGGW